MGQRQAQSRELVAERASALMTAPRLPTATATREAIRHLAVEPFWNRRPAPTGTQRSFGRRREAPLAGVLCCPGIEHRNGQRGICARLCPIKRPEIGVSLPDRNLDPAGFEETLRNRANDALLGNVPRPDLLRLRWSSGPAIGWRSSPGMFRT